VRGRQKKAPRHGIFAVMMGGRQLGRPAENGGPTIFAQMGMLQPIFVKQLQSADA
jgi:hypothetical protein